MKRALLILLLTQFISTAFALDPSRAMTQYIHDVWRTKEGLPQNSVQAICQTRDGYLWFGTQEGLVRFDGVKFTVFDRQLHPDWKSHDVITLLEDRAGNLWIGTIGGGLLRYSNGKFQLFTKKNGLSSDYVRSLYEDRNGTLWIGTDDAGVNSFKDGTFVQYKGISNNFVRAIHQDASGNLWFGTDGGGLDR